MEEGWLPTPWGHPTVVEQVVEEPEAETESQRDRVEGAWNQVEPLGLHAEAESGPRRRMWGILQPHDARGWQTRGAHTVQMGGWGWAGGGCQTTAVEEAGAGGRTGIFEERALEDRKHSQGWTREPKTKEGWTGPAGMTREETGQFDLLFGLPVNQILIHIQQSQMYNQLTLSCSAGGRSSTPHSHHPRLSPSWWALSPALAPGLTGWAQLPRQTSAQSLGFALACGSRWEMQCSTTEPQEHCTHAQVQGLYVCKHKMLLNTSWISYFHSSPFTFNGRPFLTSVTLCNFLQNTSIYDKGNTKNEVQEPIITNFSKRMKLKGVTSGFDTGCSLCAPLINRQTIRCWIADRYTLTVEKGCPEGPVGSTSNPKLNARKEQCFCLRTNPQTPSIWVWLATRGLEHPHPTVHHRQPERRKGDIACLHTMRRDLQRPSWISATPWGSLGGESPLPYRGFPLDSKSAPLFIIPRTCVARNDRRVLLLHIISYFASKWSLWEWTTACRFM